GKSRGDGLRAGLDLCPVHVSILPQVPVHEGDDPCRYGKAESFAATALAKDEGIQPDDVAIQIHQRPAAVARGDGSAGLYVDHRVVGVWLTPHRTYDTHGDVILQTLGTADRDHQLSCLDAPSSSGRPRRKTLAAK